MKYCTKCGHQMADDMMFCQKCGTKVENAAQPVQQTPQQEAPQYTSQPTYYAPPVNQPVKKQGKIRTGMKVGMIICFVFAGIYGLIALAEPMVLFMTFFFGILGLMFLLLGISPKESKYMFGRNGGLKKSLFVTLCIVGAFVVTGIIMSTTMPATTPDSDTGTTQNQDVNSETENKDDDKDENKKEEKTTMADVQKWYEGQIPAVAQALSDYAKSVDGLTVLNVNSSKFRFGEDSGWYDCHYTFTFTCKVNGVSYTGEARAFMKYNDNTVNWFHFEIFSNNSATSLVEHYDDSYDKIIEDYYKDLESKYN